MWMSCIGEIVKRNLVVSKFCESYFDFSHLLNRGINGIAIGVMSMEMSPAITEEFTKTKFIEVFSALVPANEKID